MLNWPLHIIGKSDVLFSHSHRVLRMIYQNFGTIATLLTALLKKDGWHEG